MKIINIILTSQNGGAEQVFLDYSQALSDLGHEVVAIVKSDAPYAATLEQNQIKTHRINNPLGYYDFFAINQIAKILKEEKAAAIIAHIGRAMVLTSKALKKLQQPPIFYAVNHSDNVKRSLLANYVISTNSQIFYRTIDLGRQAENSFIVPNAIDISDSLKPEEIQQNWEEKEEIVIGSLGRFDRTKGFDELIKAIAVLQQQSNPQQNEEPTKNPRKKFKLKLAGSGYFEHDLRRLVSELKLEQEVEFVGWIKDKKQFFASFDIFCLPSLNEPFGLVLLEAMKYCKPIIATNCDGPKEILRDGFDALIVNRSQNLNQKNQSSLNHLPVDLAKAIEKLANDENLAKNMVINAMQKLRQRYSMKSLRDNLAELFG